LLPSVTADTREWSGLILVTISLEMALLVTIKPNIIINVFFIIAGILELSIEMDVIL
jgi:hypothetical protein